MASTNVINVFSSVINFSSSLGQELVPSWVVSGLWVVEPTLTLLFIHLWCLLVISVNLHVCWRVVLVCAWACVVFKSFPRPSPVVSPDSVLGRICSFTCIALRRPLTILVYMVVYVVIFCRSLIVYVNHNLVWPCCMSDHPINYLFNSVLFVMHVPASKCNESVLPSDYTLEQFPSGRSNSSRWRSQLQPKSSYCHIWRSRQDAFNRGRGVHSIVCY